jgi:hypothetical protein
MTGAPMNEPRTHPIPATLTRDKVSDLAAKLTVEIRDVLSVEQSWEICERYLDLARLEGPRCVNSSSSEPSG